MAHTQRSIHGRAELRLDEGALEARLQFERTEDGSQWDAARLLELLRERGVTQGYTPEDAEEWVSQISRSRESRAELVVARGLPPEEPEPERAEFEEDAVPDELADTARDVLAGAGEPEIVVERKRTVKREKLIKTGPKLPFLDRRRKRVTVTETERVPERVPVDPAVEATGFVERGQRVATINPQKPGKPGYTVDGRQIAPRRLADPYFHAGANVSKQRNELIADCTGFLRRGVNWADVVPYRRHQWSVSLSRDRATCFLHFEIGSETAPVPQPEKIGDRARELGYRQDLLLPAEEVWELIRTAIAEGRSLEHVPISRSRDSSFRIRVTEDRQQALLDLGKGIGRGRPLQLREVGKAIKQSGLHGLDLEKIKLDIMQFYHSPELDLPGYVLAEGTMPKPPSPREVEWNVRFLSDAKGDTALAVDTGDGYPTEDITGAAYVEKDQRLATVAPPVPGEPGVDVYGATAPPEEPPEPRLRLYEGVRREGDLLVASCRGVLEVASREDGDHVRVREHADAVIAIEIAKDRTAAFLTLRPGAGTGKQITESAVRARIREAGVEYGIDEDVLGDAVSRVEAGEPVAGLEFARAQPPRHSTGPQLRFRVQLASGRTVKVLDDGTADYKNRDIITTVEKNTRIAELVPPAAGARNGVDVTGRAIPAVTRSGDTVIAGRNVRQAREAERTVFISEASGELVHEGGKLEVRQAHTVQGDVGPDTGNIRFPGSVYVRGSVRSGFAVIAGGEIEVAEGVEGALLSATGSVAVRGGIKGAGKAALRARETISARFSERATLLAGGDIELGRSCMHSDIKSNGSLTLKAKNGSIVGGEIRARYGLHTTNLGSVTGTRTSVSFGQDYLIADRIEREERSVHSIRDELGKLELSLRQSEKDDGEKSVESLRREKKKLLKAMEKRSLRLFTLRERFEHHFEAELIVEGTVYPGVRIESHGRHLEIDREKFGVRFTFNQQTGQIDESPLNSG